MIAKLKWKLILVDYELDILKKMQGLKKTDFFFQEYTEEFYRVLIRIDYAKVDKEKVAHYLNGLRPRI